MFAVILFRMVTEGTYIFFILMSRDVNYVKELAIGLLKGQFFKRRNSECKDPEAGTCLLLFKD